jgi:hypothetical protein
MDTRLLRMRQLAWKLESTPLEMADEERLSIRETRDEWWLICLITEFIELGVMRGFGLNLPVASACILHGGRRPFEQPRANGIMSLKIKELL